MQKAHNSVLKVLSHCLNWLNYKHKNKPQGCTNKCLTSEIGILIYTESTQAQDVFHTEPNISEYYLGLL